MPSTPFNPPFGSAIFGFLFWAVLIIAGGWLLLIGMPYIIKIMWVVTRILSLPFKALTGKGKKGFHEVRGSSKKLFNLKKR